MRLERPAGVEPDLASAASSDVSSRPPPISRMTRIAVSALLGVFVVVATVAIVRAVGSDPARPEIVDFHSFYLAGRTVWEGRFARSYDVGVMRELQRSFGGGRDVFMPFVYPPLIGLVLAPLALLPLALAFALFTGATLAFYLAVLRRIAGDWFWHAVLTTSPVLIINIRIGQNGFLTAGLAGLAAELLLRRQNTRAGLLTGALAFKPQIATMLPLLFALRRRWRAMGVAAMTAALLTGLAVLILGREAVPAFVSSTAVVTQFMAAGTFPIHRMTSVYAFALGLGASAPMALALHGVVALTVVIAASVAARRLEGRSAMRSPSDARSAAGIMLMATAFISPYFFDYDLTVFGAGLAFALPGLARRMPAARLVTLLIAVGLAGAMGLLGNELIAFGATPRFSLGGPALLGCFGVIIVTLGGTTRVARPRLVPGALRP